MSKFLCHDINKLQTNSYELDCSLIHHEILLNILAAYSALANCLYRVAAMPIAPIAIAVNIAMPFQRT
jgi:hypothetical protein